MIVECMGQKQIMLKQESSTLKNLYVQNVWNLKVFYEQIFHMRIDPNQKVESWFLQFSRQSTELIFSHQTKLMTIYSCHSYHLF